MSATACAIQRRVLGRRRRAEVRLQRDVAEILQREDAERVRVAEDRRHRQRHLLRAARATFANGSVAKSIGPACSASTIDGAVGRMTRKYRRSDASPVSGTTRGFGAARPLSSQIAVDPLPQLHAVGGALFGHHGYVRHG